MDKDVTISSIMYEIKKLDEVANKVKYNRDVLTDDDYDFIFNNLYGRKIKLENLKIEVPDILH